MAKVMIVPTADFEVLKKYLLPNVVLIPETTLDILLPKAQTKARMLEQCEDVYYDFGGEPDINMDIILGEDSYAYDELFREEGEDEDG